MMKDAFEKVRYKMDDAAIGLFGSSYINVEKANDILDEVLAEQENDFCVWTPYVQHLEGIYIAHGEKNITTIIDLERWTYCKHCGKPVKIERVEKKC